MGTGHFYPVRQPAQPSGVQTEEFACIQSIRPGSHPNHQSLQSLDALRVRGRRRVTSHLGAKAPEELHQGMEVIAHTG